MDYNNDSEEEWEAQDEIGEELNSEEDIDNGEQDSFCRDDEDMDTDCNSWLMSNECLSDSEGANHSDSSWNNSGRKSVSEVC